ncbi:MAG: lysine biosynthesis protein LysX [Streptosporangiales bacterium]|nr:lysine biosynthesis protein LysX [Streptosporangiales bacterium]
MASRVRYEEKQIFAALERRGVAYTHADPRRFTTRLDEITGLEYSAALLREIAHTRALYAALLLQALGVPAVNSAEVIETCGDKLRTSLALRRAGLPTPRTAVALTPEAGLAAAGEIGYPVVIKPLTGSWGRLLAVARDRATAEAIFEHRAALPTPQQRIAFVQELIHGPGRDIRVIVCGDTVVAASYRYGDGVRANVALGGRSEPCPLTPELRGLAQAAAAAVGGGVLGVDLIEGPDGPLVLEVNHTVEFRGLQQAHGGSVDVAGAIAAHAAEVATGVGAR